MTPNGAPTTYYFQYGTTTSYGAQTTTRYAGAGSAGVAVLAHVSGLTFGGVFTTSACRHEQLRDGRRH